MDWHFGATAFATAFAIIDPIGMIPVTATTTAAFAPAKRGHIIDQAVAVAAVVMLLMGLIGPQLLNALGITLPAFGIAGGILLFLIAMDMLFARQTGARATSEEQQEAQAATNPAVFPLAIPMLAGPGTLATVVLLVHLAGGSPERLLLVLVGFVAALAIAWLCMRGAASYLLRIGTTGIHVVQRVLGILLAALAVQFVINGVMQTPLFNHP
jgi:multiple antibiotic resistance protein